MHGPVNVKLEYVQVGAPSASERSDCPTQCSNA